MDWKQIEKDFEKYYLNVIKRKEKSWSNDVYKNSSEIANWFKNRIESAQIESPEKLTEEEKSEFYTTNFTADIKANYGK